MKYLFIPPPIQLFAAESELCCVDNSRCPKKEKFGEIPRILPLGPKKFFFSKKNFFSKVEKLSNDVCLQGL